MVSSTGAVGDLSRAFALAMPADEALAIRDEVAFFQALKAVLAKGVSGRNGRLDVEHAIRQIVSRAASRRSKGSRASWSGRSGTM